MVHPSPYGDGPANSSRPNYHRGHSQSFTAGSNPNSAPMPTDADADPTQRRRQSHSSTTSRSSYTDQPEPTFDLMSSTQPMFGDVNFHPHMSFDLHAAMSAPTATTSSYNNSALTQSNYDDNSFDASNDHYAANGLSDFDPHAFSAEFATEQPDYATSNSRSAVAPSASKLDSPFMANPPKLAPPAAARPAPLTDSMNKNQPQTPRKIRHAKSAAGRNQSLLPASALLKTPLAQRDPNSRPAKRNGPDSPSAELASPRKAKRIKMDESSRQREPVEIPDADQFPPVDPGEDSAKPPYTYAQMIALAIWKGKDRRRTLSQIYDFIRTTWSYYQKDDTWENSIRHNLSLHKKFFEKKAREKDDPGKGNYWLIISGNERELLEVYLKERPGHELSMQSRSMGIMSTGRLEPSALPALPTSYQEPMLPPQLPQFQLPFPPMPEQDQPAALMQAEPSTDATIPASDQAFDETDFPNGPPNFNPLDGALTSSPPTISRRVSTTSDTPSRITRMGGSSGRRSGQRKLTFSGVDSGYMTGLSSILRPGQQRGPVFSSEGDTEFQGGGRAEDAIRALRASSTTSPSKGQTLMLPPSSPYTKGSPLRYRASPSKVTKSAMTPAKSSRVLTAAPSLPPPKANSKFNNSPIRQHNKLKDEVNSMLQTPECIRDYGKKYGRRQNRVEYDSFAIFEDAASGPETESPLPANSAGRMLDELMSAKRNHKTPFIASSPYRPFPIYGQGDENTPWAYDSPSKVSSTANRYLSPSRFVPQTAKSVRFSTDNWTLDEGLEDEETENGEQETAKLDYSQVELTDFNICNLAGPGALDLTQAFRSIGERPSGLEPYGPATLHQYG